MYEEKKESAVTFAVDLSKEEYLKFYKVVARYSSAGTIQKIALFLVIAMVGIPFYSLYEMGGIKALLSYEALSLLVPAVMLLLYNFCIMPWMRKRQAEKGYDAAVAGGQVFAGMVTVNRQSIIKVTSSGSLTMPFSDRILFHEQEDMQVFINTQGRGIVLPARCMTPETANAVREIAMGVLPPTFCRIKAPVRCERTEPMELIEAKPQEVLFETVVSYEQEDRRFVSKELSARAVKASILPGTVIGFIIALLTAGSGDIVTAAFFFWGILLIFVGYAYFSSRSRAKFMLSQENFRFTFKITSKAVLMDGGERRGILSIPWNAVKHAVEGETYLEFYNQNQYICIPKKLITDIDSFRSLVDRCRKE